MKLLVLVFTLYSTNLLADQATLNSLDERLTDLELKSITDKIKTDMELSSFYGNIQEKNSTVKDGEATHKITKNTFKIGFSGEVNNEVKLYSSFAVNHLGNDDLQTNKTPSFERTEGESGSRVLLRSAYFDYRPSRGPVILTMGRLPTTNGPPEHMRSSRSRQGTYPVTNYSLPVDGAALTVDWHNMLKTNFSLITRTVYTVGSGNFDADPNEGTRFDPKRPTEVTDSSVGFSQMLEIEKKFSKGQRLLFIAQYSHYDFSAFRSAVTQGGILESAAQSNSTLAALMAANGGEDFNTYRLLADNKDMVKVRIATLYSEFQNMFGTRFDSYLSYTRSVTDPRANIKARVLASNNTNATLQALYPVGTEINLGGFLRSERAEGNRYLLGARYKFKKLDVGLEYVTSTGYAIQTDLYSDDFLHFGSYPGDIYHGYANYHLGKNFTLRAGHFSVEHYAVTRSVTTSDYFGRVHASYLGFNVSL